MNSFISVILKWNCIVFDNVLGPFDFMPSIDMLSEIQSMGNDSRAEGALEKLGH